jgi:hypothetical protein
MEPSGIINVSLVWLSWKLCSSGDKAVVICSSGNDTVFTDWVSSGRHAATHTASVGRGSAADQRQRQHGDGGPSLGPTLQPAAHARRLARVHREARSRRGRGRRERRDNRIGVCLAGRVAAAVDARQDFRSTAARGACPPAGGGRRRGRESIRPSDAPGKLIFVCWRVEGTACIDCQPGHTSIFCCHVMQAAAAAASGRALHCAGMDALCCRTLALHFSFLLRLIRPRQQPDGGGAWDLTAVSAAEV